MDLNFIFDYCKFLGISEGVFLKTNGSMALYFYRTCSHNSIGPKLLSLIFIIYNKYRSILN